jgi:hypothetical protein
MNDSGHSSNFTRLKEQLHIPVTQGRQGKARKTPQKTAEIFSQVNWSAGLSSDHDNRKLCLISGAADTHRIAEKSEQLMKLVRKLFV